MGNKAYENLIFSREVSLGIEHLLIAPYPTTFEPTAAIPDIMSPPAGFRWLGAVVEDSANVTVNRNKFQLITGVPKVIQYEAVMEVAGKLEIQLYSNSARKIQYAMGNVDALNILYSPVTSISSVSSVTNKYIITLAATTSTTSPWAVGDYVVTGVVGSSLTLSQNEAQITSISGNNIYFGTPGLPTTPVANDNAFKIAGAKVAYGGGTIKTYTLLGVADFIDGVQLIHKFDKVAPGGEFSEMVKPTDVGKIPLAFDAYGISNADWGVQQLLVGVRYWFPKA
jgi:hypothetical protein